MAAKKKVSNEVVEEKEEIIEETEEVIEETKEVQKKKRTMSEDTKKRNAITFEYMINYIETKAKGDKAWFKEIAFENEKYNHFKARKAFIDRYMPELAKKEKISKWDRVKDW